MEFFKPKGSKCCTKRLVITVLFFISIFSLSAQSQPVYIEPQLPTGSIAVNTKFVCSFRITGYNSDSLIIEGSAGDGFVQAEKPVMTSIDTGTRKYTDIKLSYKAVKAGRYIFGGVQIKSGTKLFILSNKMIEVGYFRNNRIVVPVDLFWFAPDSVYKGQAFPVILQIRDQSSSQTPGLVNVSAPAGSIFIEASGLGTLSSKIVNNQTVFQVPAASYIMTISTDKSVTLPAVSINNEMLSGKSQEKKIEVKPIPEQISASGAIGEFIFAADIDKDIAFEGDTLELLLRIEGEGNLPYIRLPQPVVTGLTFIERNEISDYKPTMKGFKGYREIVYKYLAEQKGFYTLSVPQFYYLVPSTGIIYQKQQLNFNLEVQKTSVTDTVNATKPGISFNLMTPKQMANAEDTYLFQNNYSLLFFLPGIVLLIIAGIIGTRSKKNIAIITLSVFSILALSGAAVKQSRPVELCSEAYQLSLNNRYSDAYELFKRELKTHPDNEAISFNTAYICYRLDLRGEAVFYASKAVYNKPTDKTIRSFLNYIETKWELKNQMPSVPDFNLDYIYIAMIITFNIFSILLLFRVLKKSMGIILIYVFVLFGFVFSTSIFLYFISNRFEKTGIVSSEPLQLLKIPRQSSEEIFPLVRGASVRVRGEITENNESYYLVVTGLQLKGWIKKESLIVE